MSGVADINQKLIIMFRPAYTTRNIWTVAELKKKQDCFERWFAYRCKDGQYFCFISKNDASIPCNENLVGAADSLRELKREIRKWYKSI